MADIQPVGMTTPAALRELADLLKEALPFIDTNPDLHRPGGDELSERIAKKLNQLRTAASEGGADRLLRALERAGSAESALRRLVDECDNDRVPGWEDRMRACIAEANGVLSGHEHPPEVARDAFVAEWTRRFGFLASRHDPASIESIDEVACYLNSAAVLMFKQAVEAAISGAAGVGDGVPDYGGVPIAFDDPELLQW